MIKGQIDRLYPDFLTRLNKWNDACGGIYSVRYGVRSWEDQERLYKLWITGQRNVEAAKPGPTAKHLYGLAADVFTANGATPTQAHRKLAEKYGLVFNIAAEPWHVVHDDFRRLIDSGQAPAIRDAQPLAAAAALPLWRNGSDGGQLAIDVKQFLKRFYPSYSAKLDPSNGWLGQDTWNAMDEFVYRSGLTSRRGTLTAWGPKCWEALHKAGFRTTLAM